MSLDAQSLAISPLKTILEETEYGEIQRWFAAWEPSPTVWLGWVFPGCTLWTVSPRRCPWCLLDVLMCSSHVLFSSLPLHSSVSVTADSTTNKSMSNFVPPCVSQTKSPIKLFYDLIYIDIRETNVFRIPPGKLSSIKYIIVGVIFSETS